MQDVVLRPARPDDALLAAPLMYSSGPKAFDFVFAEGKEGGTLDFLFWAFQRDDVMFSYRHHWVAEVDGKVLGLMGNFTKQSAARTQLANGIQMIRYLGLAKGLKALMRGLTFEIRLVKPPLADCLNISHVGVAAESRGMGLGSKLIDHAEKQARIQGFKKISLDVSVINPRAQQLYERLSFKVLKERQSYTDKLDNHRYMECQLN
jgi:ribosomal protein S18 acetylase RimI-like enzyme